MSTIGTSDSDQLPLIVSVDDHVVEPRDLFDNWLPQKFRDHPDKPRVERRGLAGMAYKGGTTYEFDWQDDAPQADCWIYGDLIAPHKRHVAAVGFSRDEMTASPITYDEMRPGCYDPAARLEDMSVDGVEASLCFPTMPRFCGQTFAEASDKDLAMAGVHAYNNWLVEGGCGDADGRRCPGPYGPRWAGGAPAA
ncbi:MAG: amidohydrolase, partial [Acidimicrobiia bacterium]|nr:amidohydrolase [Acidimicrobiia bacterium]